jgi:uncharacterized phage protein (TIGR01671 family)
MSNTYKFRGRRLDNQEWVFGYLCRKYRNVSGKSEWILCIQQEETLGNVTSYVMYEVDSETVGQFTGLCDKNGKEIYEGNIVQLCDSGFMKAEIFYDAPSFKFKWLDEYVIIVRKRNTDEMFPNTPIVAEIIDNIHSNPELLGKSDA